MTEHTIHDALPSGFAYADRLQIEQYEETGSVNGASKVCLVRSGEQRERVGVADLAVRLRPPRTWDNIVSPLAREHVARAGFTLESSNTAAAGAWLAWYIAEYNNGWQASSRVGRTGQGSEAWDSGKTSAAWDDGYLDQAAGRPKWHLTYCAAHDECGEA